jgi:hypothetical protein
MAENAMSMTVDVRVGAWVRVELPPSLDDREARRLAEVEAVRRVAAVRGVVAAEPLPLEPEGGKRE